MPPFVPDIPYQIQAIFIGAFAFIWGTAFIDDYNSPLPLDPDARTDVLVTLLISLLHMINPGFKFIEMEHHKRTLRLHGLWISF